MKVKESAERVFIDPVQNGVVVTIEPKEKGYRAESYVFTSMADLYNWLSDQLEDRSQ